MKVDFRKAALEYARHGWPVFPIAPGAKIPAIKGGHGVKDATTDADQIERWAKAFPNANIAIACGEMSGIVVLDVDPRNGGHESLSTYAAKGRVLPPCPRAKTGNDGLHFFFRWQAGVTNSKKKLGSGIDIKSTGGYVLTSPSWTAPSKDGQGGSYRWEVSPFEMPVPRLPIWLSSILCQQRKPFMPTNDSPGHYTNDSLGPLARFVGGAPKGERNQRTYWAACRAAEGVLQHRISQREAEIKLLQQALTLGLDQKEALATIRSAFRMVMQSRR